MIDIFKKKLALWVIFVQKGDTQMFPTSSNLLTCADLHAEELLHIITQNLKDLANNFDYDFPEHELL